MTRTMGWVAALAAVLGAAPARAASPVTVEAGLGERWVTDRAFDAVSDVDGLALVSLAAVYRPAFGGGRLGLRAGWGYSGTSAVAYQSLSTSFALHTFDAGATWRLFETGPGALVARGAVSLDVASLSLAGASAGTKVSGYGYAAGLQAAVGYELWHGETPEERRFGMLVEAGYGLRVNQPHFVLAADTASDAKPAPVAAVPVDAGRMGISGPFWRIAALIAF